MSKSTLRTETLERREELSHSYRDRSSNRICEMLVDMKEYKNAQVVAFYKAMRNEVDLDQAMEHAFKQEKIVVIPRVVSMDGRMDFYQIFPETKMIKGSCGAFEPPAISEYKIDPTRIDLVLVPGAAFDYSGYRLGYGGGFFDRFFTLYPDLFRIGVAFEEQVVSTVYPDSHDQPVNYIITPDKILTTPHA